MIQYLILLLLTVSNYVHGQYCQPIEDEALQRAKILTLERRIDSLRVLTTEKDSLQLVKDEKDKQLHLMYEGVINKCEQTNEFITEEVVVLSEENEALYNDNDRLRKNNKKAITIGSVLIIIALII